MRRTLTAILAACAALAVPATASALPTGNLLQNPGAEDPAGAVGLIDAPKAIPGWTAGTPALRAVDEQPAGSAQPFLSAEDRSDALGCRFFVGPGNPGDTDDNGAFSNINYYNVHQDVTVTPDMIGQTVNLGAALSRYNDAGHYNIDFGEVDVYAVSGAGVEGNSPIATIDNYSPTDANGPEITNATDSAVIPAGTAKLRVYVFSVTGDFMNRDGYAEGGVDNVYLTFDGTPPASPAPGCGPAALTLGPATDVTQTTATIGGTTDPHGEATTWRLAYSTDPALDGATGGSADDVTGAGPVAANLVALNPNTTYYYRLESVSYPNGSGPGSAYPGTSVKTDWGTFRTAAPSPTSNPGRPDPVVTPPATKDPFASPLRVSIESFKQKRQKALVSGFEYLANVSRPGTLQTQLYVRDVKNKAKRYACGDGFKERFSEPTIAGRRYQANGVGATSRCAAQLRAKSFRKKVGRKSRKVKVSSNTMIVVWSFVDTKGNKASGTFSYVING